MLRMLKLRLLLTVAMFVIGVEAVAQKRDGMTPPSEAASLGETQKWLVEALTKQASYKTRVTSVTISNPKVEGCIVSFTQTRKSGSASIATMGATRRTNTVKDDVSFDLAQLAENGIAVSDHIYPELQTLELRLGGGAKEGSASTDHIRTVEIVVQHEATDAIKAALMQLRRLCTAKN